MQSQKEGGIFYDEKLIIQQANLHTEVRFYKDLQPLGKIQTNYYLASTGIRLLRTSDEKMSLKHCYSIFDMANTARNGTVYAEQGNESSTWISQNILLLLCWLSRNQSKSDELSIPIIFILKASY